MTTVRSHSLAPFSNLRQQQASSSKGGFKSTVLMQISEPSVSQRDLYPTHSGQDVSPPHVSRRIGAVGSSLAEQDPASTFNSTTVPAWCPAGMPLLAITCSTNEPLYRILQWIRYHQLIGFSLFYFFVEGKAKEPEVVDALRSLVGVKVCPRA